MNSDNSNNLNYSSSDEESNFFLKSHQNKNQSNNFNNNENNINNYNIENLKNSPSKNSTLNNNDISEIKDNKKEENQIETNSNSFLGKKQKHPKKKQKITIQTTQNKFVNFTFMEHVKKVIHVHSIIMLFK